MWIWGWRLISSPWWQVGKRHTNGVEGLCDLLGPRLILLILGPARAFCSPPLWGLACWLVVFIQGPHAACAQRESDLVPSFRQLRQWAGMTSQAKWILPGVLARLGFLGTGAGREKKDGDGCSRLPRALWIYYIQTLTHM